ncbi:DNA primase [Helicobacter sp. 13S00401-1]|uniref:DNA primase n=1 Tax=Helicobacter sp. 13S00401-1 TaxID=1905758 RepID=UPI000BA7A2D4|nr:DNA primase [Helicobacter sp. 13S00401-1]PAF50345.1 DNA primase [Helicobacter sp. 13S00401-1]
MIKKESLERLKDSIDLVELISNYIEVKKAGINYMALCPFHNEKTPSFVINKEKGFYHCYGCGQSGDGISFLMEYEKLDFNEAATKLASMFNVTLEYTNEGFSKDKPLSDILGVLAKFYHSNIYKHKEILEYLTKRGVSEESIEAFKIGYCASSIETMNFIEANKLSKSEALELGVITEGNDRIYAKFANRIIFPIQSNTGNVVGFGGRTLSAEKNIAKYLNSPQSRLFNKSKLFYGYNLAKPYIYNAREVIITEGYLDVIMLFQAGIKNVVATLGTALNEQHVSQLKKLDSKIRLCFDGDGAGVKAAFRAASLLAKHSFDGSVSIIEGGLDPADMMRLNKKEEFLSLIKNSKDFFRFVLEEIVKNYNLSHPVEKKKAYEECLSFLNTLDPFLFNEYKSYVSLLLGMDSKLIAPKRLNVQSAKKTNKIEPTSIKSHLSIAEKNILLSMKEDVSLFELGLNYLDSKNFSEPYFFEALLEDRDTKTLNFLYVEDNLKTLNLEDFTAQLRLLLLGCAMSNLEILKNNIMLDPKERFSQITELQKKIAKLRSGELVIV